MPERRKKSNLKSTRHHAATAKRTGKPSHAKGLKAKKTAEKTAKKAAVKKAAPAKAEAAKPRVQNAGKLQVFDVKGKALDTLALDPMFHEGAVNAPMVWQAVLKYQAGKRLGTAETKTRGEVRGGGKKPWRQKGTGQARHGSRRSPIWRGGGATFGPHQRDYSYELPQQLRRSAVAEVVKEKVIAGKAFVLNQIDVKAPKTREIAEILETFKLEKPLFVVDKKSENFVLASRNLPGVGIKTALEVNALDVASHRECVMTKAAYDGLVKRLKS